jgi:hypothetical protein
MQVESRIIRAIDPKAFERGFVLIGNNGALIILKFAIHGMN